MLNKFFPLGILGIIILSFSTLTLATAPATTLRPASGHVALTFDDGPNPKYTPQILAILKQYNIKATFFMMGEYAQKYPDLVKQVEADGHVIADHTMTHPMLTKLSDQKLNYEIGDTSKILKQITGIAPVCLRPPYGKHNAKVDQVAASYGMQVITWDLNSFDYERKGTQTLEQWVLSKTYPRFVVLMHDGGGDRSQTVAALPTIIEGLRKRGIEFDTICSPSATTATTIATSPST